MGLGGGSWLISALCRWRAVCWRLHRLHGHGRSHLPHHGQADSH